MNYEQEYKNAFEAAKGLHEAGNVLTKKQMEIVFPRLAESEDERIRKFLIDYFTSYKIGNVATKLNGYRIDDILAYLEKQKEPENTSASTMIPCCWEVEQKEHDHAKKPSMLELLREHLANTPKEQLDAEFEALKEFTIPKPAEWSEEDEEMLNSCISSIEEAKENRYAYKETDGDTSYDHEIAWLKSLRNRVGKEFLQPHWKPSDEQMKALLGAEGISRASGYLDNAKVLASLYEQLKKL